MGNHMRRGSLLFAALAVLLLTAQTPVQGADPDKVCARRINNTLGINWRQAYSDVQAGQTAQSAVRTWLRRDEAIKTFAGFINSRFNGSPGVNTGEDTLFFAVKFILTNARPWRELYTGRYVVDFTNGQVAEDATFPALGYFGSKGWQKRYQGNEEAGYMLQASYRTLQNTLGIQLVAAANNATGDATATGRERVECRGCHYDSPYALDKVARLLPRRVGFGGGARIEVVPVEPQTLFNDVVVHSHEELLQTLVNSDHFTFWTCRLAFEFVYGRPESACEADIFDRCVDAFESTGMMEDALASLLEDPAYCQESP